MRITTYSKKKKTKQKDGRQKNHERNFQNEKQCFSTSKRIHTCITFSLCEDQLKCKVCLRQRLYYGWESAYIFPHWRDWWFQFFFSFLDSLVHFDSCSQSNPPSKVDALYHNFYGNSWIISELDCLMHKMDSSWKPFSSWCITYTWNTSLMRLNSWRSCIYCDCQPMSLHHFYLGFFRVFPSINIITTILLLLLRRYPLRYYNKCGVDDHRRLCKWIGMTMDQ